MGKIRSIKPDFFIDEDLAQLEPLDRIAFAGLWTCADRDGRIEDRPGRLGVQILPYNGEGRNFDERLERLAAAGFIVRYRDSSGHRLLAIKSFSKHQRPHHTERPSVLEPPPESHGEAPEDHGEDPEGREGKGREGNEEGKGTRKGGGGSAPPVLLTVWNENRGDLPEAKGVSRARLAQIRARLAEEPDPMVWTAIVQRIAASPFCRGENDREWRASFDWLLKPDTRLRALEGKYDALPKRNGTPHSPGRTVEDYHRELIERQERESAQRIERGW